LSWGFTALQIVQPQEYSRKQTYNTKIIHTYIQQITKVSNGFGRPRNSLPKNMDLQNYHFVLCNNRVEESLAHLLIHCPFAESYWAWINYIYSPTSRLISKLREFQSTATDPFFHVKSLY
jgi:hypothetical protein